MTCKEVIEQEGQRIREQGNGERGSVSVLNSLIRTGFRSVLGKSFPCLVSHVMILKGEVELNQTFPNLADLKNC